MIRMLFRILQPTISAVKTSDESCPDEVFRTPARSGYGGQRYFLVPDPDRQELYLRQQLRLLRPWSPQILAVVKRRSENPQLLHLVD